MKKKLLFVAYCSLLVSSVSWATTASNDTAATLSVTGQLTDIVKDSCHLELNKNSMTLTAKTDELPKQGEYNSWYTQPLLISVLPDNTSAPENSCGLLIANGELGVKVSGTPDNADGTTLANTLTGDTAASGVGINLFEAPDDVLNINSFIDMSRSGYSGQMLIQLEMVKLNGQTVKTGAVQSNLTVELVTL